MIQVSNAFKENINKKVREIDGIAELVVNGGYFQAKENELGGMNIEATNKAVITNLDSITDINSTYYRYASFENNYFILDGSLILPNKNYKNKNTGYISSSIGGTGTITITTNLVLMLTRYEGIKNITIYFDDGYATDFSVEIDGYYEGQDSYGQWFKKTITYTYNYTDNNKMVITTDESIIPSYVQENGVNYKYNCIQQVRIGVTNWNNSEQRIRIRQINVGETVLYYGNELIEIDVEEETSLDNTSVPNNECSIKISNIDNRYDITDKNSILNRLNKKSFLRMQIGVLIDGAVEYVDVGSYRYSSYTDNRDKTITLIGTGSVEDYSSEKQFLLEYGDPNVTTSEVFNSMLSASSGYNNVGYNGIVELNKSNFETKREQLQALAVFSSSIVKQNRNIAYKTNKAIVSMIKKSDEIVKTISLDDQLSFPKIIKNNKIKKITINCQNKGNLRSDTKTFVDDVFQVTPYIMYDTQTYQANVYIKNTNSIDLSSIIVYKKDLGTGIETQVTNFVLYNSETYPRVQITDLTTSDNVGIRVIGKEYDTTTSSFVYENTNIEDGEAIDMTNNLLTNEYHRRRIVNNIFNNEKDYEFEIQYNGDPSLEVGDTILIEVINGYMQGCVSTISTKYTGGLTQIIKGVCNNVL